jgi:hypothetical protein
MPRSLRTAALLAAALLAATAATEATAAAPRGLTFTDPANDANFSDGAAPAGSQASFDVLRVRITPYARTRKTAGLTIRVDLAAAPSTAPGSSYVVVAQQNGCDITASHTASTEGASNSVVTTCGPTSVSYWAYDADKAFAPTGKSLTFVVPPEALLDAGLGARLSDLTVATSAGEPVSGLAAPAHIDTARAPKPYVIGS